MMAERARSERYQPFYCEENAWWLARSPDLAGLERWLAFVSNPDRRVAMWAQRAAPPGIPVVWDYHVVVVTKDGEGRAEIWDLDHRPGRRAPAAEWIRASFPVHVAPALAPRFRLVPHAEVLEGFASDRRHMRDPAGVWSAPPPPWEPIQGARAEAHTLDRFLVTDGPGPGALMDREAFEAWVARRGR